MTLASKVTAALTPLLDPEATITESQLRYVTQQQRLLVVEDESTKLRFF
jgi:hypothetical protein